MMEVIRYNEQHQLIWDQFVDAAKNGIFFFKTGYLFYHSDRFTDHSLLIFNQEDELLALLPANESGNTIYSHQGLTFGSLVLSHKAKAKDVLDIFGAIKHYYKEIGFNKIIYKQLPYHFYKYPSQEDAYALFVHNAILYRRDISSVIQLSRKLSFSPTKKNLVNRCIKNGIRVVESEDFNEYWALLSRVLEKFGTKPVHNIEEIKSLKGIFSREIRLFEARDNNQCLLAGLLIFDFGNTVHTQYMANSDEGRKIGALDYINHYLINEIYKDKEYYSFGISNENNGRYLNEGLIQQKELLGARGICLDFYEINL